MNETAYYIFVPKRYAKQARKFFGKSVKVIVSKPLPLTLNKKEVK